ncbi:hypothetical protein [Forsythia suspensa noda-like virus]|nr:hypothetical protein [Forsythia suspensa noda-like virus]
MESYVHPAVSKWLSKNSEEARAEALCLKTEFQDAVVKPLTVVEDHTHGASASARSTASFLIRRIAEGVGRNAFYLQGSGADFRAGRLHSRRYFWLKDIMCPASASEPGEDDVLALVDVDYYFDMPDLLIKYRNPLLMYTFVPSRAAKAHGEYKYVFLADGRVHYRVSGGGKYTHHLWNWDGDSVSVVKTWWGIPWYYAGYAIERRQMDADHQLILLAPLARATNPLSTMWCMIQLQAERLRRFNPIIGEFVRFYVNESDAMMVATGKVQSYAEAYIPADIDDTVASTARTISNKLTLPSVKSKMEHIDVEKLKIDKRKDRGAEIVLEFHIQHKRTIEYISILSAVRRFQWIPPGAEPDLDAKPGMEAFMRPLLDGGFVPDVCEGNDKRFVEERMKKVATKDADCDQFTYDCMQEFAQLLIPEAHVVQPREIEEVYERQNKPSQQAIMRNAENESPTSVTKQFMKREAYGSVTDPRGISQINGPDKRDYSCFMYAFAEDVMKNQEWYAFGKTPVEIAERVATICSRAKVHASNTDFSRMDGRVSSLARLLEKIVMFRAFPVQYHAAMYELMRKQTGLTAVTTFGVRHQTGNARLSGSPETSNFNTLLTAFIAYYTWRRTKKENGAYYTPVEAWNKLGIYGGDDGLSEDMNAKIATESAKRMGQVLDLQTVKRGEIGVSFLARRFGPDVWFGDNNSCCDIKRQLAKFHLTVNLPSKLPPWKKLQEKSFAFSLSDSNTPILGEFVVKALELYPLKASEFKNVLGTWGVEMDVEKQYPNRYAEWMDDLINSELPDFDVDRFRDWLRACDGGTIFDPPAFAERVPPNPKPGIVAVDGDMPNDGNEGGAPSENGPDQKRTDARPHYRARKPKAERNSRKLKPETEYCSAVTRAEPISKTINIKVRQLRINEIIHPLGIPVGVLFLDIHFHSPGTEDILELSVLKREDFECFRHELAYAQVVPVAEKLRGVEVATLLEDSTVVGAHQLETECAKKVLDVALEETAFHRLHDDLRRVLDDRAEDLTHRVVGRHQDHGNGLAADLVLLVVAVAGLVRELLEEVAAELLDRLVVEIFEDDLLLDSRIEAVPKVRREVLQVRFREEPLDHLRLARAGLTPHP